MKILLLEDDKILSEIIEEYLVNSSYEVTICYSGYEAEELAYEKSFDLFLFDVNVPDINGFTLLVSIRKRGVNTPAIFITSLNTSKDMQDGFASGADDYIKKPFEIQELLLRINNIKRIYNIDSTKKVMLRENIKFDMLTNTVTNADNIYSLTKKEAQILQYLYTHSYKNISTEELISNVWEYDNMPSEATIRTYIKNLRKYIGEDNIVTVKSIGYRFNKI
ncbi:MAG: response regulator transcription factor [Sulfurovum sp.]|nr:MAG: response regulator transcription factor [Sulfurovum sp.]